MDLVSTTSQVSISDRIWSVLIVLGLVTVMSWGLILTSNLSGRGAADDLNYHWLAIQQFSQQLPSPDLSDYPSATTPGYHLLLSPFVKVGFGHMGIQLIASAWTLAMFGFLTWVLANRFGKVSTILMLPMITSMYVFYPGVWLLPDNAGWFGVLLILMLSLKEHATWKTWALSSVILFALVWIRQIHIWIAGVIWFSAWLGTIEEAPSPSKLFSNVINRSGRTVIAVGLTIPAASAIVWFVATWGGLVPPTFQGLHQGPNLATPGFILTQLAILSVFFVPMLWESIKDTWKHQWSWVLVAALIGMALGIVPESSYSYDAGRYSGWWNLINKLPVIAQRSPVYVLGSISGSVLLVVWFNLVNRRDAWIWIGAFIAFVLAQSANHASWQRYHEPMLLIMFLLILARSNRVKRPELSMRWLVIGSCALAGMLAVLTTGSLLNANPVETQIQHESSEGDSL
ncbi:MAG: hypothetical protein P1U42_07980 [Phycisphaerales bacterium]|nr:hypothetical protein [Phycisphaerales bacterium]